MSKRETNMRKNLFKSVLLIVAPFMLLTSCNNKKEEPIVNKDESTIIKNAKNTDEYLKKQDYKSIAYAYIYNIKEGLKSYESETSGSVRAKVMFFNYDIKYHTVTHKFNNVFYSKDDSKSTFMNIQNEFYMAGNDKIVVSKDLKKYNVYTVTDYMKTSYTPKQYTIMGYVFNDQSIIKTEVVTDKGENVSIKYTLDNELATNWVKVDLKNNGGLSSYPTFKNIEITLEMKRDFTPVSYSIDATYDASKPVIGTGEVKQEGKCEFRKVNETITIPNEAFLAEKLGTTPSEIVIDKDEEIKDELFNAIKKLDYQHGVNVNGAITLDLFGNKLALTLDANASFDVSKLKEESIYDALNLYLKAEGDENFNSLISLVKMIAQDKLGEYAGLLDSFKSIEVIYDGNGQLFLVPTNQDGKHPLIGKVKLTDIVDVVLSNVNIYGLVTNTAGSDFATLEKKDAVDKDNYKVAVILNEDVNTSIRNGLDKVFENPDYALLKTLLKYKDFDSIKMEVTVKNGMINAFDASFNYLKEGDDETPDTVTTLITAHFEAKNQTFDFAKQIENADSLYSDYQAILELKGRLNELIKNVYVSKTYLANLDDAYAEYTALSDIQKGFIGNNIEAAVEGAKKSVNDILLFLDAYKKYDLNNINNEQILELLKAYRLNSLNNVLLSNEMGADNYNALINIAAKVDYTSFDNCIAKFVGEDETAWGLTEAEIRGIKLLFDIAKYDSSVKTTMTMNLFLNGCTLTIDVIEAKINALYNALNN